MVQRGIRRETRLMRTVRDSEIKQASPNAMVKADQHILPFPHYPAYSEEDFLVGETNRHAYAAVLAWPNWSAPILSLTGPARSGKSHLCAIWAERSEAVYLPLTMEGLALFKEDVLPHAIVIEDVDQDGCDQNVLFHVINALKQTKTACLMSARMPLATLSVETPDLHSRLRAIPSIEIELPDDDLLRNLFLKLFSDRQITPTPDLIAYLLARAERSFEAAHNIVEGLDQLALKEGRAITRRLAVDYFREQDD